MLRLSFLLGMKRELYLALIEKTNINYIKLYISYIKNKQINIFSYIQIHYITCKCCEYARTHAETLITSHELSTVNLKYIQISKRHRIILSKHVFALNRMDIYRKF